jgi:MtN3 and saliva related transmembrane protein
MDLAPYAEAFGAAAGTLTTIAFVPQVVKTIRSGSTRDISLTMWAMFWVGVVLWTVYGLLLGRWAIIIPNCLTLVLAGIVLVIKLRNLGKE